MRPDDVRVTQTGNFWLVQAHAFEDFDKAIEFLCLSEEPARDAAEFLRHGVARPGRRP